MTIRDRILGRGLGIGATGRAAEKRASRGGRPVPGSGAGRAIPAGRVGPKGDYEIGDFLVEVKSTTRGSLSLRRDWLEKITNEARGAGKEPALQILFVRGDGTPIPGGDWVAVPRFVFDEMAGV